MTKRHERPDQAKRAPGSARAEPLSEERIRRLLTLPKLLAQLSDIVSLFDAELRFVYVSRVTPNRRLEDVLGTPVADHVAPASRDWFVSMCQECLRTGIPNTTVAQSVEDMRWWENRYVPFHDDDGTPFLLVITTDITERKQAEQALAERESQLRHAIDASGVGTWSWDKATDSLRWDDGVCRIYGVSGQGTDNGYAWFVSHVHPDDRPRIHAHVERCLTTGIYDEVEHRALRDDGTVRVVFSRGTVLMSEQGEVTGLRGGVIDITAKKRLEEQLRHVQKMEAVGQLTAGIAHNFNNLISVVLPNVELCRSRAPRELHPMFDDMLHAAERATEMVRQLMRFARRDHPDGKVSTDLVSLARHTVGICRATFDRRITLTLREPGPLPPVLARAGEIEQVLLNLCLNARDALEDARTETPRITITLDRGEGGSVRLSVHDNGPGIDAALRERVFEPFFTTKEIGKGTGLGLASAYAIVDEHRGRIRCEAPLEGGCVFVVELPVADKTEVASVPDAAALPRGSERVLLVDDEPLVRRALRGVLEQAGFVVREAGDGAEGLALVAEQEIDIIVLDRSMPRMSGEQFLARLGGLARRPPVVLLTGCPGEDVALEGVAEVLLKPPRTAELIATVRRLLDASQTA